MVLERAAPTAFVVSAGIAENGGPSNDMSVADLDEKVDYISSAKVILTRVSAETRDENAFEEASALCVPLE